MNVVVCINDGDTHNAVFEALEAKNPVVIERYALRPDSGGAGRYRGGLGVEVRIRAVSPMRVSMHMDRTKCAPWGLEGGGEALPNRSRSSARTVSTCVLRTAKSIARASMQAMSSLSKAAAVEATVIRAPAEGSGPLRSA